MTSTETATPAATSTVTSNDIAPTAPPVGNPAIVGLPGFVLGSIALTLQLLGFVPPSAAAVVLPIAFGASAISTFTATLWAARVGDNVNAVVFVTFTGFWLSYTFLTLAVIHGWLGIPADQIPQALGLFLVSWLGIIAILTIGTLRLPRLFSLIFVLVDINLICSIAGVLGGVTWANTGAGIAAAGFTLCGAYLLIGAIWECGGGKPLPVGTPLIHA
jgi:uncharacterized protein